MQNIEMINGLAYEELPGGIVLVRAFSPGIFFPQPYDGIVVIEYIGTSLIGLRGLLTTKALGQSSSQLVASIMDRFNDRSLAFDNADVTHPELSFEWLNAEVIMVFGEDNSAIGIVQFLSPREITLKGVLNRDGRESLHRFRERTVNHFKSYGADTLIFHRSKANGVREVRLKL